MLKQSDLPPCPPEWNFVYCPDPMQLTDEELNELFPRERRLEFWRDLARLATQPTHQHTGNEARVLEEAGAIHA